MQQKKVSGIGAAADDHLEKHFFKRLGKFSGVKRFVAGWLGLIAVALIALFMQTSALQDKYQSRQPVEGGNFIEGMVGNYSNANPIYASNSVDVSVSRLVFSGLFTYDDNNNLVPELAESLAMDKSEKVYTVKLKRNLSWHDGRALTSQDVVFTYNTIQNPDAKSPLASGWRGVNVEAVDEYTVKFTLPGALSSFPHSLTNGLLPKHLLEKVKPEQLRSSDFNTSRPVGSGPFKLDAVEVDQTEESKQERVGLVGFKNYVGGEPRLNRYIIRTFASQEDMEKAFGQRDIVAMSGGQALPDSLAGDGATREFSLPLAGQVMVFFRTSQKPLDSSDVRKALTLGVDKKAVLNSVGYQLVASNSPLLKFQAGYNPKIIQKTNDKKEAAKLLDKAGWKMDKASGTRKKGQQALTFSLYAEANSEYASVTQNLQAQWKELGVDVKVILQSPDELQSTVAGHNYESLLYAVSSGVDPDSYAYWHSSQADIRSSSRLNFSEYKSSLADNALLAGRSRSDPKIRAVKYEPFLRAWTADNPALALYQPRYLFVVRQPFYNFNVDSLVTPADRYNNVERWMMREGVR